jgi:hypothetical protein
MRFSLLPLLPLAALCGLLLAPLASGITIRDDTPDSSYINLGANPAYQAAGYFDGGSWGGTLIADPFGLDQYVVTATHLVQGGLIVPGTTHFIIGGNTYDVAGYVSAPNYDSTNQNNDLTIVRLATSVSGVTPIPYYTGIAELSQMITMIGYGLTGTGVTGAQNGTGGIRRGANNVIDALDASTVSAGLASTSYLFDFDQPPTTPVTSFNIGSRVPLTLEGMIAPGDSGGGDFATIGGVTYLVGVHSYIAAADGNANASYSDVGGSTRVSLFSSFIAQNVPEPASAALLLGGVTVLCGMRRRRQ